MSYDAPIEELGETHLLPEGTTRNEITETIAGVTENPAPRGWWLLFLLSVSVLGVMGAALAYLFIQGVGVWGNNAPVYWAWDITNFVWWIGIGHAGTLISAILFLFRQKWRTSINRFAEAMTVFAVLCAGLFPAIHTGRSVIFWYVGLIPDFATLRDRSKNLVRKRVYGFFALGWRGAHRHWQHYERAYLIFAGISTPLVLSVHSVVSFDFATSVVPGWHTTIFPPYFVAGAVFSGFALVMTLMLICRSIFKLHNIVTIKHLDLMNKFMLGVALLVGYAYAMEFFIAWYSSNPYEQWVFFHNRLGWGQLDSKGNWGPLWWAYYAMVFCNVIVPQIFWFKRARTSVPIMLIASVLINIGMWFERFVIIVTSTYQDFLPSSWGMFHPTLIDILTYLGTFGLFFTLFLLFVRWIPMIAIAEVKGNLPGAHPDLHALEAHDEEPDTGAVPVPAE
jgi:molybdopterin-containing oxidoreductase family membrane subunit